MRILLAVIEDLYTFAASVLFGWWRSTEPNAETRLLPTVPTDTAERASAELQYQAEDAQRASTEDAPVAVGAPVTERTLPQRHTIVYCAEEGEPLRTSTEFAADTVITTLSYGDMLMVLEAGAEWSFVAAGEKQGYIRTAALAHKAAGVYPEFTIGDENGPREPNTIRLRSVIRDEFSAGLAEQPLQAHEYVYYKLMRRGVQIDWPDVRPRTPGTWTDILAVLDNVSFSTEPSVGAVMETAPETGKPHLAYVEKVFDDRSILISEADYPDRGIYNERMLVEQEWRSMRPTFIVCA